MELSLINHADKKNKGECGASSNKFKKIFAVGYLAEIFTLSAKMKSSVFYHLY